jgi:hypothetical protein
VSTSEDEHPLAKLVAREMHRGGGIGRCNEARHAPGGGARAAAEDMASDLMNLDQ